VHLVPGPQPGYRPGAQPARCGTVPTTDLDRWGVGRWRWTDDAVDCRRCKPWLDI
jgi:hypothetical protein